MFSLAILVIIFFQALYNPEKNLMQQKLFMLMLLVTLLMLVMDMLSRFDGNHGKLYPLANQAGNFFIFLLSPVLPSLWLLYAYSQLSPTGCKNQRWLYLLPAVTCINAVLLVLSQFFGWYYVIGPDNIYHRGPLYMIPVAFTALLTASAYILVIANRSKIKRKHFISLVLFPAPPIICIFLQVAFYGISFVLNGAVLSILIAFISIQNERMNTDYLTGAYNRHGLEAYLRQKINTCTENRTFSIVLLDLDNFKAINDSLGHSKGDHVLKSAVKLLKGGLKSNDFVARFGGDEFCIVLNISKADELDAAVNKIQECIESYNRTYTEPFTLSASIGHAVYDYHAHMSVEEFQKQVDTLMYENKRAKEAQRDNILLLRAR